MSLTTEDKRKALEHLNKANDILTEKIVSIDEQTASENIFCPLGEVISNVEELEPDE